MKAGERRRDAARKEVLDAIAAACEPPHITDWCESHPDTGHHECMKGERRCVYCGLTLATYQCNGCGRFLSAARMHDDEFRCKECA
jgi:hypothetical protein